MLKVLNVDIFEGARREILKSKESVQMRCLHFNELTEQAE